MSLNYYLWLLLLLVVCLPLLLLINIILGNIYLMDFYIAGAILNNLHALHYLINVDYMAFVMTCGFQCISRWI